MDTQSLRHLADFASIAQDLGEKQILLRDFRRVLEKLEQSGRAVTGEMSLLKDLESHVDQVKGNLNQIAGGVDDPEKISPLLADLRRQLEGSEWRLLQMFHEQLAGEEIAERDRINQYRAQVDVMKHKSETLREAIAAAEHLRAPVRNESSRWKTLSDLENAARRQLGEGVYALLPDIDDEIDEIEKLITAVQEKTEKARPFAQLADLLMLRSPKPLPVGMNPAQRPANGGEDAGFLTDMQRWWLYTVMLRSPQESGGQGVSIQRSSTVVPQDRQLIKDLWLRLTRAVGEGVARRGVGHQQPVVTPSPGPSSSPGIDATGPVMPGIVDETVLREVQRRFLFGTDPAAAAPDGLDTTELIQHIGDLMYRLVVPEQMQDYLQDASTKCSLTITTNDLELPWELMHMNGEFLCLDRPVGRLPMGRAFPRRSVVRGGNKTRFLLIYADPTRNLRAAKTEIDTIEKALLGKWQARVEVDRLNLEEATGRRLNQALSSGEYDVIHYAGHGFFNQEEPELSGLLLHEKEVFVSQKVQRLLEGAPLVFLNACETAVVANEQDPQQVDYVLDRSAGLSSAFLYGGAIGCIGSLWPIYDEPAAQFAIAFYNRVLEGNMVGQAMLEARHELRERFPDSVTWAAFVLYGSPTAVL